MCCNSGSYWPPRAHLHNLNLCLLKPLKICKREQNVSSIPQRLFYRNPAREALKGKKGSRSIKRAQKNHWVIDFPPGDSQFYQYSQVLEELHIAETVSALSGPPRSLNSSPCSSLASVLFTTFFRELAGALRARARIPPGGYGQWWLGPESGSPESPSSHSPRRLRSVMTRAGVWKPNPLPWGGTNSAK